MRSAFYSYFYRRNHRPFSEHMTMTAERYSATAVRLGSVLAPVCPVAARLFSLLAHHAEASRAAQLCAFRLLPVWPTLSNS